MSLESLQAAGIQNQTEIKSSSKSETFFAGASEDLFIEAKKEEDMHRVADLSGGNMAQVDDKNKDDEDPRKKKKDMEFLLDVVSILYRFGVIKKKMEKKQKLPASLISSA